MGRIDACCIQSSLDASFNKTQTWVALLMANLPSNCFFFHSTLVKYTCHVRLLANMRDGRSSITVAWERQKAVVSCTCVISSNAAFAKNEYVSGSNVLEVLRRFLLWLRGQNICRRHSQLVDFIVLHSFIHSFIVHETDRVYNQDVEECIDLRNYLQQWSNVSCECSNKKRFVRYKSNSWGCMTYSQRQWHMLDCMYRPLNHEACELSVTAKLLMKTRTPPPHCRYLHVY